ncbi:MAG: metallophosphoesterase [Bacilli bacterium]|nr:metallophosphoesterase [Bacilli bacterium]
MDNKITINSYNMASPKVLVDHQIAFISDIHSDDVQFERILKILRLLSIKTIIIGGDLVDSLRDKNRCKKILKLLEENSNYFTIYVSIGNHDMVFYRNYLYQLNNSASPNTFDFWKNISSIDNVNVSDIPLKDPTVNKWTLSDDIDITALNMPISYYKDKEPYSEYKEIIKTLETINLDKKKFNILLSHSPKHIIQNGEIDEYLRQKRFNLILSGHVHGGLVPIQFRIKQHGGGFVGPYSTKLPEHAYGTVKNGGVVSLTSAGVIKIAHEKGREKFKGVIDNIYPSEIEIINLSHKDRTSFQRVKSKKI